MNVTILKLKNYSKSPPHTHTDETQKLLKDLAHRKPLQVPNIFHHLPHLLNNEGGLHPAVQVGQGRTGGKNPSTMLLHFLYIIKIRSVLKAYYLADLISQFKNKTYENAPHYATLSGASKRSIFTFSGQ